MTKPIKLILWIASVLKLLAIGYIAIFAEMTIFMQLVILPLLLLESLAIAGYVYETPTLTSSAKYNIYLPATTT